MGQIKRNINTVTDLRRGSTLINYVYRGAILVWQRITPSNKWKTDGISTVYFQSANTWITDGITTNYK